MRDPAFIAEAKMRKMDLAPMTGAELHKFFVEGSKQSAAVVARTRKLAGLDRADGGKKKK